jgi:lipopolysaccharide/colanic/teichoic acid biosynthesis glycosyltransferase
MDVWYVDHLTFKTDVGVIIDTVKAVLKREGISGGGEATMSEFLGMETRE